MSIKKDAFKKEFDKLAFSLNFSKIRPLVIQGAAAGSIGIAMEYLLDVFDSKMQARKAAQVFELLYKDKEFSKYPREVVLKHFSSIAHHSPRVALDPVAAKSYLLHFLPWEDSGTVPPNFFSDLAGISQKNPTGGSFAGREIPKKLGLNTLPQEGVKTLWDQKIR